MVDLTGVCYLPMRQSSGCRFGCMFLGLRNLLRLNFDDGFDG